MGRPPKLPEPLATLATKAGSVEALRRIMGDVPASTFGRWRKLIEAGAELPRSATTSITLAMRKLASKRPARPNPAKDA